MQRGGTLQGGGILYREVCYTKKKYAVQEKDMLLVEVRCVKKYVAQGNMLQKGDMLQRKVYCVGKGMLCRIEVYCTERYTV